MNWKRNPRTAHRHDRRPVQAPLRAIEESGCPVPASLGRPGSPGQASADLDRILSAFSRVEPSADLDARLLATVAQHRAARSHRHSYRLPAALAAAILLALAVAAGFIPRRTAPSISQGASAPGTSPVSSVASSQRFTHRGGESVGFQPYGHEPSAKGASAPGPSPAEPADSEEALARSEMLAPSQPAPPEPLTPAEQALLRAANASREPPAVVVAEETSLPDPTPTEAAALTGAPAPVLRSPVRPQPTSILSALREGLFAGLNPTSNE